MTKRREDEESFLEMCRTKFKAINHRVKNRACYRAKSIENKFSFPEFVEFARDNGLENGKHCHRPDRHGNYCKENLEFITPQEHYALTGREKRKLSDDQIKEVVELSSNMSLRKIAKRFSVSHVTIYRYLQKELKEINGTE